VPPHSVGPRSEHESGEPPTPGDRNAHPGEPTGNQEPADSAPAPLDPRRAVDKHRQR
jgi:hypothetical protein